MKCSKCGAKLKNQGTFCPNCGAEILPKKQNARKKLSKKVKAVIACICIATLIISGTVSGSYFFRSHTDNLTDPDSNYISFTEGFTDVLVTDEKSAREAIKSVADVIGIENVDDELKISSTNTVDSDTYYRFQQYYNGIPVYGRNVILAADENGTALTLTGNFVKIKDMQGYDFNEIDKSNAVVYGLNPPKICKMSYESKENGDYLTFTDIKTGKVVDGLCKTYTASEKSYPTQEADGIYSLYDSKRNIRILNSNGKELKKTDFLPVGNEKYQRIFYSGNNKEEHRDLFSDFWGGDDVEYIVNDDISIVKANTVEDFDSVAIKLMDNINLTYDFYSEKLGRNGFDNNNGLIFASYNDNFDNGGNSYASIGSLLCFGKNQNLSVDLIAHEYTHSVELTISNMNYECQSGAIMEGYSDIFGEIIEDYADGKMDNSCNWINNFRNIKEPLDTKNPEVYEGENWETTEDKLDKKGNSKNDHGHVHNNSTVISHTAYLMNIGIDGTESKKIGTEKLAKIWYRALFILQSDATFSQCRNAVELSARILKENGELTDEQYNTVSESFEMSGISKNVFTYFKTVKNDFDLLVLNAEGKKDLEAKIKIYKYPKSFFGFLPKYDTEKMELVEETVFNSISPDTGEHFKLDDGKYIVEISDNLSDVNKSIKMELKVDGNDEKSTDKITIYTDFEEVTTVMLNPSPINLTEIYLDFLKSEKYTTSVGYDFSFTEYAILDIDGNGIEELLLSKDDGTGFHLFATFSYDDKTASIYPVQYSDNYEYANGYISQFYSGLSYSKSNHALNYNSTNDGADFKYTTFDTINDKKFETLFTLAYEIERSTGERTYYKDQKAISEKEYNLYFDDSEPVKWNKFPDYNSLYQLLTNSIWESRIQSSLKYKFNPDGKVYEYGVDGKEYLYSSYKLEGSILTFIYNDGEQLVLKYVHKNDKIDWHKDEFFYNTQYLNIGDDEGFFYEVDYEADEMGLKNAMWLRESKYINSTSLPENVNKEENEKPFNGFYGNETPEQLRKSIIGSWGALGSMVPEYNFLDSKNCSGEFPWQSSGTYSISNGKALTISWAGKTETEQYIWSSETWDEFYSHRENQGKEFWYMTSNGVLKINGKEKYRDGVDNSTYNSDGELMEIITGTWISNKGHKEYQINSDGTWIENAVVISGGRLITRTQLDNGKVEIVDDTTAKLWQETKSLSQIPGASELIYDSQNDKISVGGANNTYSRAKYK